MRVIKPLNNNGSIQFKFSYKGKRYSLNPIKGGSYGDPHDMAKAQTVATQIQLDILAGHFDESLERYSPHINQRVAKVKHSKLLSIWDCWVESLSLPPQTKANHYECVRRTIAKTSPEPLDIDWFTTSTLSPSTYNKRLGMLKSCLGWGVRNGMVDHNPYEKVRARKESKTPPKPFTPQELAKIFQGFDERFPHYGAFVRFLAMTGTRISESIGLRWEHVSFDRNEVVIRESTPRDRCGNGYQTIRKGTKTGSVRHLTMTPQLRAMLISIHSGRAEGLVFKSAKGCPISADNFRSDWREVLTGSGVEYRSPHKLRHTLLSMAVEAGTPLTGVAYLAGHQDSRMVMQTYGHMINRPSLPPFPL